MVNSRIERLVLQGRSSLFRHAWVVFEIFAYDEAKVAVGLWFEKCTAPTGFKNSFYTFYEQRVFQKWNWQIKLPLNVNFSASADADKDGNLFKIVILWDTCGRLQ